MIVRRQPGCPCCESACAWTLCVYACGGYEVGTFTYEFTKSGGAEGSSGGFTPENQNPYCLSGFASGGLTTGTWSLTVTPTGGWEAYFAPATIEFTVACPETVDLSVTLTPLTGWDCDGDCEPCPGLPAPTGDLCFELSDGTNTISLENYATNEWLGCRTYSVSGWKWCPKPVGPSYTCYEWATVTVPILYHLVFNCPTFSLTVYYPAGWNAVDSPTCDDYQAGASLSMATGCTGPELTAWSGSGCSGSGRSPEIVCNNHWRLVGDLSCDQFRDCAGFTGGSATRPTCPSDPDYGTPSPIRVMVGGLTVSWDLDCDAASPYEAEVTVDLTDDPDACFCGATGAGTGTETEDHPLAAILGTSPTFTLSLC